MGRKITGPSTWIVPKLRAAIDTARPLLTPWALAFVTAGQLVLLILIGGVCVAL